MLHIMTSSIKTMCALFISLLNSDSRLIFSLKSECFQQKWCLFVCLVPCRDLRQVELVEPHSAASAQCIALYLRCQLLLHKVILIIYRCVILDWGLFCITTFRNDSSSMLKGCSTYHCKYVVYLVQKSPPLSPYLPSELHGPLQGCDCQSPEVNTQPTAAGAEYSNLIDIGDQPVLLRDTSSAATSLVARNVSNHTSCVF